MSSKSPNASALILGLGVAAVFSISFLFYSFFWKTKTIQKTILPAAGNNEPSPTGASMPKKLESPDAAKENKKSPAATPAAAVPTSSPVVMDEDSDDEDDEDDEATIAAQAALKTAYDDALRVAKKLLAGEKYFKAAEKFSEAIRLAEELGGAAANDITTLYNNRSAMYEKCGELEQSLSDIGLVLAMEALHLKARVRRARIYEVQNKMKLSCVDYMVAVLIEMTKNQQPSHQEKIEALVRLQAADEIHAVVEAIRNAGSRDLPSKSHCRNYFETFPSYYRWRDASASVDRDSLVADLASVGGGFSSASEESAEGATARLAAVLTLARHDIVQSSFKTAAAAVEAACAFVGAHKEDLKQDASAEQETLLADLFSLHGTFLHLRANFIQAKKSFLFCLEQQPLPQGFENALRLASVHLEVDSVEDATKLYDAVEASLTTDQQERGDAAWLDVHRMSEWVTRDSEGKFRSEALEMSTACVQRALDATREFGDDATAKSCHLMALLKMIQLVSQTKGQMGLQPDNNDLAKQKECIDRATDLFPQHETVLMLGADLLSQEGRFAEAISHCDSMLKGSSQGQQIQDAILLVVKANVLCQMGMTRYAEAQQQQSKQLAQEAQQCLEQGQLLYGEAIEAEPNCIEALIQLAQLKSMMGPHEMDEALSLCNQALPHARSRDEALDIMQLKLMMDNRLVAINEMRANGMQI